MAPRVRATVGTWSRAPPLLTQRVQEQFTLALILVKHVLLVAELQSHFWYMAGFYEGIGEGWKAGIGHLAPHLHTAIQAFKYSQEDVEDALRACRKAVDLMHEKDEDNVALRRRAREEEKKDREMSLRDFVLGPRGEKIRELAKSARRIKSGKHKGKIIATAFAETLGTVFPFGIRGRLVDDKHVARIIAILEKEQKTEEEPLE
jgi:hypothetical protein